MVHLNLLALSDASPIHFEQLKPQLATPVHDHEFYEIAIVLEGTAKHQSHDAVIRAEPGDVFVIPRGVSHAWSETRQLELLNIYYRAEPFLPIVGASGACSSLSALFFAADFFPNPAMQSAVAFQVDGDALDRIRQELADIHDLAEFSRGLSQTFWAGCFLKILTRLTCEYERSHSLSPKAQAMHPTVYRLLEILNQHAASGDVPAIGENASQLGMSLQHLTRLFTIQVGVSPFRYFNQRRLEHAKALLRKNVYTHTEIAYRLGYSDSAHFSRIFKEKLSVTPSEFKRHVVATKNLPEKRRRF